MFYEAQTAVRTIRQEGVSALLKKVFIYASQLKHARRFLASHSPYPSDIAGILDYERLHGYGLFPSGQVRSEIAALAEVVQQLRPKNVLEIGTANGGTLFLWCRLSQPDGKIISLDLPGGIHGGGYPAWRTKLYSAFAAPSQDLHLLRADSHSAESLDAVKQILRNEPLDFLFIDGDHSFEGVKMDFTNFSPLVRKGGVVALHDVAPHRPEFKCEVNRFWNEVKARYPHREVIEKMDQGWAGIGILQF